MKRRVNELVQCAAKYPKNAAQHRFLEGDEVIFSCDVGQRGQLVWAAVSERFFRVLDCQSHTVCFEFIPLADIDAIVESDSSPQIGVILQGDGPDVMLSVSSQGNREALLGSLLKCRLEAVGVGVPLICIDGAQFAGHLRNVAGEQKRALPLPASQHDHLTLAKNASVKGRLRSHGDCCVYFTDRIAEIAANTDVSRNEAPIEPDTNFTIATRLHEAPPELIQAKPSKVVILSDGAFYLTDKAGKVEFRCPVRAILKVGFVRRDSGAGGVTVFYLSLGHAPSVHPDVFVFAARRGEGLVTELREVLLGMEVEVVNFSSIPPPSPPPPYQKDLSPPPPAIPSPRTEATATMPPFATPSSEAPPVSVSPPSTIGLSPHSLGRGRSPLREVDANQRGFLSSQSKSPEEEEQKKEVEEEDNTERMAAVAVCETNIAEQLLIDRRREAMLGHFFGTSDSTSAPGPRRIDTLTSPTPSPRHNTGAPLHQPLSSSPADLGAIGFGQKTALPSSVISPSPRFAVGQNFGEIGGQMGSAVRSKAQPQQSRTQSPPPEHTSSRQLFGDDFNEDDIIGGVHAPPASPPNEEVRTLSSPLGEDNARLREQLAEATARLNAHIEANDALQRALGEAFVTTPEKGGGGGGGGGGAETASGSGSSPAQRMKDFLPSRNEQMSDYFVSLQSGGGAASASDPSQPTELSRGDLVTLVALKDAEISDLQLRLDESKKETGRTAKETTKRGVVVNEKVPRKKGFASSSMPTKQMQAKLAQKTAYAEAAVAYSRCVEKRLNHIVAQRYPERLQALESALNEVKNDGSANDNATPPGSSPTTDPKIRAAKAEYEKIELLRKLDEAAQTKVSLERQVEHIRRQGAKVAADIIEKAKEKAEELSADASSARLHLAEAVRTVEALQAELERQRTESASREAEQARLAMATESELRSVFETNVAEIEERAQHHERRLNKAQAQLLQDLQAKEGELHFLLKEGESRDGGARANALYAALTEELRVERERTEHVAAQFRIATMQIETLCVEAARTPEYFAGEGAQPLMLQQIGNLEGRVIARDAVIKELREELQRYEPVAGGVCGACRSASGSPGGGGEQRSANSMPPYTALRKLQEQEATMQSITELNRILQNKVSKQSGEKAILERKLSDMTEQLQSKDRQCSVAVMKVKNEIREEKQRAVDARAKLEARSKALETGLLLKHLVEDVTSADAEGWHDMQHHHQPSPSPSLQGESTKWATTVLPRGGSSRRASTSAATQNTDQYDELMDEHLRCKTQLTKAQEQLERAAISNTRHARQLKLSQRDADSAKAASEEQSNTLHGSQEEVSRLKIRLAEAKRAVEEGVATREALTVELRCCRQRLDEDNIAELDRKLLRSTDQFEELNRHFEAERQRADQLQKAYLSLETEHKSLIEMRDHEKLEAAANQEEITSLRQDLATQQAVYERRHQESIRDAIEKAMREMGVGLPRGTSASRSPPLDTTPRPASIPDDALSTQDHPHPHDTASPELDKIATIRSSLKQNPALNDSRIDRCVSRLYSAFQPEDIEEEEPPSMPTPLIAPPRAPSNAGRKRQAGGAGGGGGGTSATASAASSYAMRYNKSKRKDGGGSAHPAQSPPQGGGGGGGGGRPKGEPRQFTAAPLDSRPEDTGRAEGGGTSPRMQSDETAALYAKLGLSQLAQFAAT